MAIIGPAVRWAYHYRPMSRGTTNITNITNTYSGARSCGCGGGMSWLGGLFMGLPMMFMGIMSMIPMFRGWRNNGAEQVLQQQKPPQQTAPDKNLARLKELFPKINWTDDEISGRYTGVTEDGKMYRGTYDQILNQLANPGQIREATTIAEDKAAAAIHPEGEAPAEEPSAEEAPAEEPVAEAPAAKSVKATPGSKDAQAVSDADNKPKEWTDEEKAKPIRLSMKMATVNYKDAKGSATVVTPDGKTYPVRLYTYSHWSSEQKLNEFSKEMKKVLAAAGWTNVTLENKHFKWSSDGSEAVGDVDTPDVIVDKTKHHDMTVVFCIRGFFNDGSATVTTPDGELYQVTTDWSSSKQSARDDLVKQLKAALAKDDWTDFTLTNATDPSWVGNDASYVAPEIAEAKKTEAQAELQQIQNKRRVSAEE